VVWEEEVVGDGTVQPAEMAVPSPVSSVDARISIVPQPSESYPAWFARISGQSPHPWQSELGARSDMHNQLIRIPTGFGKTLGVLLAWAFHRLGRQDAHWPRRLVWCLPMRVLVEQTEAVVRETLARCGLLWESSTSHAGKVGVHLLMGGADAGGDWNLFPEECAVLIGTQDMLLSRALNRGYASGRARWPLEFGLLSHDALWIMDEVQLMDVGLATSAQLQAFHDDDAHKALRPRHSWWMSATLQPEWLRSVDTEVRHAKWIADPVGVSPTERSKGLGSIQKGLTLAGIVAKEAKAFAKYALDQHQQLKAGDHGVITLIVCNTVDRACATFDELRALAPNQELKLVHSRFRPAERADWRESFLSRAACTPGVNRIIVATQVVEAGVDISAGCVVTDLAPWPSLVQRFGRCARYGDAGSVHVVDRGRDEKSAPPYAAEELDAAWAALGKVARGSGDVGIAHLETFEESLTDSERRGLYPHAPPHLLIRREFDELFDTTPDLTGADLDISRFIRTGEERDLQVFWLDVEKTKKSVASSSPPRRHRPRRDELCGVPFLRARTWLCGDETQTSRKPKLRGGMRAWVWDWIDARWVVAERAMLTPGRVVCVSSDSGGYRLARGFDPTSGAIVTPVPPIPLTVADEAQLQADEGEDAEDLSAAEWKTIACHGGEVAHIGRAIGRQVGLADDVQRVLVLAGLWHDLGKAHPAFQGAIRLGDRPARQDLAKAPPAAWPRPPKTYRTSDDRDLRPGLRHELASALGLFAVLKRNAPEHPALLGPWIESLRLTGVEPSTTASGTPGVCEQAVLACSADEFDLLAYLVLCHHGKVRVSLHAGPKDQDYRDRGDNRGLPIRGVREGDVLPGVVLDAAAPALPALALSLEPASLGLSAATGRSWRERTLALVDRHGPGALAWLEALIIAADRRASKLQTTDPALSSASHPNAEDPLQ